MPIVQASEFATIAFDYLIVGGGVAGLTLAARLSEDKNVHVGVVEAGRYVSDMPEINIPGYLGKTIGNPDVDWMHSSEPQKFMNGTPVFQPRGKVLGGSSALNFMVMTRATIDEYNSFEALGNEGWNWSEFLKYFRKSEGLVPPPPEDAEKFGIQLKNEFHGTDGPLHRSYPIWYPDMHVPFLQSLAELGLQNNADPYSGENAGSFTGSFSINRTKATRDYATTAFYEPNAERPNLYLLTEAQVTKVLTKSKADGVVATGIEYVKEGNTYTAGSSREVILSAGAFQSPQLLELSGIGDSNILKKFGIEQVLDLPSVGQNLQDHPNIGVIREVKPDTQTFEILGDPVVLAEQATLYGKEQKGMFSSVFPGYAMIPFDKLSEAPAREKILEKLAAGPPTTVTGPKLQTEMQNKWLKDPSQPQIELISSPLWFPIGPPGELTPVPGVRYHSIVGILLHPYSKGSVHIKSADPLEHPAIDPEYLSQSVDLDLFVETVKYIRKLMMTGPLAEFHQEFCQPGPEVESDDQIKEWVSKYMGSTWHPLGTASMLPKEDGGVVDKNLLVYGTKNLRVVDASVIPFQLSCHIQATIYAIAEKAADIIKEQHAQK